MRRSVYHYALYTGYDVLLAMQTSRYVVLLPTRHAEVFIAAHCAQETVTTCIPFSLASMAMTIKAYTFHMPAFALACHAAVSQSITHCRALAALVELIYCSGPDIAGRDKTDFTLCIKAHAQQALTT